MAENTFYWLNTHGCSVSAIANRLCGADVVLETASTIGYTYYIFNGNRVNDNDLQAFKAYAEAYPMEQSNIEKHRSELACAVYNMGLREFGGIEGNH